MSQILAIFKNIYFTKQITSQKVTIHPRKHFKDTLGGREGRKFRKFEFRNKHHPASAQILLMLIKNKTCITACVWGTSRGNRFSELCLTSLYDRRRLHRLNLLVKF